MKKNIKKLIAFFIQTKTVKETVRIGRLLASRHNDPNAMKEVIV